MNRRALLGPGVILVVLVLCAVVVVRHNSGSTPSQTTPIAAPSSVRPQPSIIRSVPPPRLTAVPNSRNVALATVQSVAAAYLDYRENARAAATYATLKLPRYHWQIGTTVTCNFDLEAARPTPISAILNCRLTDLTFTSDHQLVSVDQLPKQWVFNGQQMTPLLVMALQHGKWIVTKDATGQAQ